MFLEGTQTQPQSGSLSTSTGLVLAQDSLVNLVLKLLTKETGSVLIQPSEPILIEPV